MTRGAPLPARDSTRTSPAPSRRDALRWAGLAGLGVAGAGTLGACANRAEPPPARDLITPTTVDPPLVDGIDRKSTRLNSSHVAISYAVFCLKKKKKSRNECSRQSP